jgi:DNA primase
MEIYQDIFWDWAIQKFGEDNVIANGAEICINSPFVTDDQGHHMWCNPEKGVYHCFKSDAAGTLLNLVMDLEGCDFPEALEILGGSRLLYKLEEKLLAFLTAKKKKAEEPKVKGLALPPDTFKITALSAENRLRILATNYLTRRKLAAEGLYICGSGKYAMRIIIPYYGPQGQLIYFNSRDITGNAKLRYRGPEKQIGIGKADVIWMQEWPAAGETIYLTEGEFDAMSLCQAGFHGAAVGGKNFSDKQLQLVKQYNIIMCFDLDESGLAALNKIGRFLRAKQFVRGHQDKLGYVVPAQGYKDWNAMLIELGAGALHGYIKKSLKVFDQEAMFNLYTGSHHEKSPERFD